MVTASRIASIHGHCKTQFVEDKMHTTHGTPSDSFLLHGATTIAMSVCFAASFDGSWPRKALNFHMCAVVALMAAIAPGRRLSCHHKKDETGKNKKGVKVSTHGIGLACVSTSRYGLLAGYQNMYIA